MIRKWPYRTTGVPDALFIRDNVPMTKEEVRVITLAKARLAPGQVVWDIGAGTGSLSIEAALQVPEGSVYAVERNASGILLINSNSVAFGVDNITVVEGEAPEALKGLPDPDRVIIGGSGGRLQEIIIEAFQRMRPGGRIVINAATLETAALSVKLLDELFSGADVVQVSVSKAVKTGSSNLFKGFNPVTVISAEKGESSVAG